MKIKSKSSIPLKALIGLAAAAVLVGSYIAYSYTTDSWPFDKAAPETETSIKEVDEPIGSSVDADKEDPTANTPIDFTPPEDSDKSKNDTLTGIINYKDVVDNKLIVRTTINHLLSSGDCSLKLTSETGKTFEESSKIIAGPSTSTCEGFSIPTSKLTSGEWNIEINLTSGDKQGTLKSKVTI